MKQTPIHTIPKAEIHVHLEGSITPTLAKKLAARHKTTLPEALFGPNQTYRFRDFLHFLKAYDVICSVVKTPEDYRDIAYDYLIRSAQEGVIYTELMPSPDHAALHGISYDTLLESIAQGIQDAEAETGIKACIYVSCVRHYGVEKCESLAKTIVNYPHPLMRGFGMGGDEVGFPPKQFKKTYQIVNEAGIACTAHAGEMAGPEGIKEALSHLPISRIGHGVRSIEDDNLIAEIIDKGITLECCPTSNVMLRVYDSYASHPFLKLKNAGVNVTLNSDDPPFFATTIGNEYQVARQKFQLSDQDLVAITRTAIQAGFLDEKTKQSLLQTLPKY